MTLTAKSFRVQNYRNIVDSGWIELERVSAFVGRNESGKSALLKALHKFNPATKEPYDAVDEFPRDRYVSDYTDGKDWPVCSVKFELDQEFRDKLFEELAIDNVPTNLILTRYYDNSLRYRLNVNDQQDSEAIDNISNYTELTTSKSLIIKTLEALTSEIQTLIDEGTDDDNEAKSVWTEIRDFVAQAEYEFKNSSTWYSENAIKLLENFQEKLNTHDSQEIPKSVKQDLQHLDSYAKDLEILHRVLNELPVFIYFENYGILESEIYFPQFLHEFQSNRDRARVRTVNALFEHVKLSPTDIAELGREDAQEHDIQEEAIKLDLERKRERSIKLSSASNVITEKFSKWYGQRRHKIRYDVDGQYFRIWISDDRRPNVEIELENRSKGFQWFFSFYLIFLVESQQGHKNAILLLDEPGLNLHPTAQQDLISFFDELSKENQLLYTTHSPFLIDGEQIHRVRPVTEDEAGHSQISQNGWPADRDTIFPLQAAAGYAMLKGLFQRKKNLLVEGFTDYMYLHALNLHCAALGHASLPEDVFITPCGGTKHVGHIAALFLGQKVRPLILLDGDEAGRVRRNALTKELYSCYQDSVILLDDVLGQQYREIEDVIGLDIILQKLNEYISAELTIESQDNPEESVVPRIKRAAKEKNIDLPEGWKNEIARRIATEWSTSNPKEQSQEILKLAELLFENISSSFTKNVD
ncbi:MAG: AAA family ATPase [Gammaproteobacteria bacterium]|nr:AAA family ATPase [Gammaproteobacteria bacterium]MDE0251976.1 AAA family ATPase [Gammaproteobacteria bacterium]MDE0402916.1 AAA family ATPase [Gammaproteobacteria bacterium]